MAAPPIKCKTITELHCNSRAGIKAARGEGDTRSHENEKAYNEIELKAHCAKVPNDDGLALQDVAALDPTRIHPLMCPRVVRTRDQTK